MWIIDHHVPLCVQRELEHRKQMRRLALIVCPLAVLMWALVGGLL